MVSALIISACTSSAPTSTSPPVSRTPPPTLDSASRSIGNTAEVRQHLIQIYAAHKPADQDSGTALSTCPLGAMPQLLESSGIRTVFDEPISTSSSAPASQTQARYRVATGGVTFLATFANSNRIECTAHNFDGRHGLELDYAAFPNVSAGDLHTFADQVACSRELPIKWASLLSGCKMTGGATKHAFFETGCFAAWRAPDGFALATGCIDNQRKTEPTGAECRTAVESTSPVALTALSFMTRN